MKMGGKRGRTRLPWWQQLLKDEAMLGRRVCVSGERVGECASSVSVCGHEVMVVYPRESSGLPLWPLPAPRMAWRAVQ